MTSEASTYLEMHRDRIDRLPLPAVLSAPEIMAATFPPPAWVVPGLIPEGLSILAGAPKQGKTFFAFQLASALSRGGTFLGKRVDRTETLAVFLEDSAARIQRRFHKTGLHAGEALSFAHTWGTGEDALLMLAQYLSIRPETKFIIVDTLGCVKPKGAEFNSYDDMYSFLKSIGDFCRTFGVSVLVIAHLKKSEETDWLMRIGGSAGITGGTDTNLVLERTRGEADAVLHVNGREVEESDFALRFNRETCTWELLGDAGEYAQTKERRELLDILKACRSPEGLRTKEIASALGKSDSSVSYLLRKLADENLVETTKYGHWKSPQSTQSPQSDGDIADIGDFAGTLEGVGHA